MRAAFLKVTSFLLITIFSDQLVAQLKLPAMVQVSPQTPNSAALGKFGSYPVTLNTGLIDPKKL